MHYMPLSNSDYQQILQLHSAAEKHTIAARYDRRILQGKFSVLPGSFVQKVTGLDREPAGIFKPVMHNKKPIFYNGAHLDDGSFIIMPDSIPEERRIPKGVRVLIDMMTHDTPKAVNAELSLASSSLGKAGFERYFKEWKEIVWPCVKDSLPEDFFEYLPENIRKYMNHV
jgi:hypothetical protein